MTHAIRAALAALLLFSLTGLCLPPEAGAREAGKPVTMADVLAAAKARQGRVKTARFTWTEQRTEIKGSISAAIAALPKKSGPAAELRTMPPEDTTVALECSLEFTGESIRFHTEGKEWSRDDHAYLPFFSDSSFHKGEARTVRKRESPGADYPNGAIMTEPGIPEGGQPAVRILTHAYRATTPNLMPFSLSSFSVSGRVDEIEGVECVELVLKAGGRIIERLWLAPSQELMMVRLQVLDGGAVRGQLTVRNERDATVGWVPTGWTFIENDRSGALFASVASTLGERSFNHDVPEARLALEFPPGSGGVDQRTLEAFVTKRDGRKRVVLPSELRPKYDIELHEKFLNTETGQADAEPVPDSGRWRWWVGGVGITIMILAGYVWYRRRNAADATGK